ncbi:hypothetical protein SH501x_001541 [Pirellulaceae bacterium SH501]
MLRAVFSILFLLPLGPTVALAQSIDKDLAKLIQEREKQIALLNDAFLKKVADLKKTSLEKLKPDFDAAMTALDFDRSKEIKTEMDTIQNMRVDITTGKTIFSQNYDPAGTNYSYFVRLPHGIWIQVLPEHLFRFTESHFDKGNIEMFHENSQTLRIRGKKIESRMASQEKQFKDGGRVTWLTDVWVDGVPQPANP